MWTLDTVQVDTEKELVLCRNVPPLPKCEYWLLAEITFLEVSGFNRSSSKLAKFFDFSGTELKRPMPFHQAHASDVSKEVWPTRTN